MYEDLNLEFVAKNSFFHELAVKKCNKVLNTCTIASELYTVIFLSSISVGRAKRGRTSPNKVARSKPTLPVI